MTSNSSKRSPATRRRPRQFAALLLVEQKPRNRRLKDFSENIVESLNVGVLAIDLEGIVESWNTRMEQLFGVAARKPWPAIALLASEELAAEIANRHEQEQITGIYKQRLHHQAKR